MPLPRLAHRVALAAALAVPSVFVAPSFAQPAEGAAAPVEAVEVKPSRELQGLVDNFWHYGKIGRYELAVAEGEKILASGSKEIEILVAFETVASMRKDNLDQWMLRWSGIDATRDVTRRLQEQLNAGYQTRRNDPGFIKQNIEQLSVNERGYALAIGKLRQSGEVSVPIMVQYLRDPSKAKYHGAIRRALRDIGRPAVNPLVASTEMKDHDTLLVVVTALGDLGYDSAAPYLQRLVEADDTPATVKEASRQALTKLNAQGTAADLFNQLAEAFYYDRAAITADPNVSTAVVWRWQEDGLVPVRVPSGIFNEVMAMRAAEYSLKLGGGSGDSLSLWLASNYKREVELPEGQVDATRAENQPDAHYYGVSAGAQYLNAALARALKDNNSAVALKVIRSLNEIAGQSNSFGGQAFTPLVDALTYPDRLVRFEAAFALAEALPQQPFEGSERVVPLLAEAVSQSGAPSALIVMATQDEVNSLAEGMKGAGGIVATGATTAEAAIAAGQGMAAVDVIIVSEDLNAAEIEKLFNLASATPKLSGAAKLVLVKTGASPFEARKQTEALLSTTQSRDPEGVRQAMEAARVKAGALPVDPAVAGTYATRGAELLKRLAISRGQVMDVSAARMSLLSSLQDPRPEIVKLVGETLALIDAQGVQEGLIDTALAETTSDELKISLLNSLSTSAKFHGNRLDQARLDKLMAVVAEALNLEIRSAAAEAHGALNLPADQAKKLIVGQMKV